MAADSARSKTPVMVGTAAAAGLVGGVVVGARRRRDPGLTRLAREVGRLGKATMVAGRRLGEVEEDLRVVREQAEESRRQSAIEVVLSALTSRRLPRHR
jgi:hypothetical protein